MGHGAFFQDMVMMPSVLGVARELGCSRPRGTAASWVSQSLTQPTPFMAYKPTPFMGFPHFQGVSSPSSCHLHVSINMHNITTFSLIRWSYTMDEGTNGDSLKSCLNKFKKIEITAHNFPDHNSPKLKISPKKKKLLVTSRRKTASAWMKNLGVRMEITEQI